MMKPCGLRPQSTWPAAPLLMGNPGQLLLNNKSLSTLWPSATTSPPGISIHHRGAKHRQQLQQQQHPPGISIHHRGAKHRQQLQQHQQLPRCEAPSTTSAATSPALAAAATSPAITVRAYAYAYIIYTAYGSILYRGSYAAL